MGACGSALDINEELLDTAIEPTSNTAPRHDPVPDRSDSTYDTADLSEEMLSRPGSGVFRGTGKLIADPPPAAARHFRSEETANGDEGITLNLVKVPIADAAKAVLGDILSLNYIIDPNVQGDVTVQTTSPVPVSALADLFDAVLKANGAAIVEDGTGVFKIVPSNLAMSATPSLRTDPRAASRRLIGIGIQIVPLRYVSATEMERILRPIAPQGAILLADTPRNLLMLTGTRKEMAALLEAIAVFDVDWMKGMSFALVPVRTSDLEGLAEELKTIFAANAASGANTIVRFIPNERLQSMLVISSRPEFLDRAEIWITRLDAATEGNERRLHVYNIQNRTADELAGLLQQVFAIGFEGPLDDATAVGPRYDPGTMTSPPPSEEHEEPAAAQPVRRQVPDTPVVQAGGLQVVADDSNNALLIFATRKEYNRILQMLTEIDQIQNQVLLEATIAEVTLNDELKFGLRWFFESGDSSFSFTDAASGAISSVFPGFSYFFNINDARVVINAVSGVTDVNIISSPSLMVLDNKTATLQVGAQVPIATQSAVSVLDPDAPIVNSIELRDTGVILSVTPRVNDSGRVTLEIEQEVSEVSSTTTSGIDSPTIQQRRIKTTVVVNDGESLALGGLIQNRHSDTRTKVPIVGDIPLVGTLFRNKSDDQRRTELLILITPRVVRDLQEARGVTAEFRRRLQISVPRVRRGPNDPAEESRRITD